MDFQAEYSPAPPGIVHVLQEAAAPQEFPRLALGKPKGGTDLPAALEKQNFAAVPAISFMTPPAKPRLEEGSGTPSSREARPLTKESEVMELVFDVDGDDKKVQIFTRPLGAEFSKRGSKPARINKVHLGSYACELGLKVGWAVKEIDGEDMRPKTFEEIQKVLKYGLRRLPEHLPQ